jgi:TetR/AcrR family transcriptional regulator
MLTYMESRTRKPTEVRRQEIAGAALTVIGSEGASALTAAKIAKHVGVTSGALFRHFPSLEAILDEAVDRSLVALDETFPSSELPPLERLRAIATARIALLSSNPGLSWLLMSDQVYLTVSDGAVSRLRAMVKRSRSFLLSALREAIKDGTIRRDVSAENLLVIFTGTVHSLVGARGVHRGRTRRDDALDALFTMLAPHHNTSTSS